MCLIFARLHGAQYNYHSQLQPYPPTFCFWNFSEIAFNPSECSQFSVPSSVFVLGCHHHHLKPPNTTSSIRAAHTSHWFKTSWLGLCVDLCHHWFVLSLFCISIHILLIGHRNKESRCIELVLQSDCYYSFAGVLTEEWGTSKTRPHFPIHLHLHVLLSFWDCFVEQSL